MERQLLCSHLGISSSADFHASADLHTTTGRHCAQKDPEAKAWLRGIRPHSEQAGHAGGKRVICHLCCRPAEKSGLTTCIFVPVHTYFTSHVQCLFGHVRFILFSLSF